MNPEEMLRELVKRARLRQMADHTAAPATRQRQAVAPDPVAEAAREMRETPFGDQTGSVDLTHYSDPETGKINWSMFDSLTAARDDRRRYLGDTENVDAKSWATYDLKQPIPPATNNGVKRVRGLFGPNGGRR